MHIRQIEKDLSNFLSSLAETQLSNGYLAEVRTCSKVTPVSPAASEASVELVEGDSCRVVQAILARQNSLPKDNRRRNAVDPPTTQTVNSQNGSAPQDIVSLVMSSPSCRLVATYCDVLAESAAGLLVFSRRMSQALLAVAMARILAFEEFEFDSNRILCQRRFPLPRRSLARSFRCLMPELRSDMCWL